MSGEADKSQTDWGVVERHYRVGLKSLRTIADENGITEGAIRKRAKRDGWTRNLEEKIQEKAKEKVRKALVRTESTQLTPETEKATVEAFSDVVALVDESQRKDVQRALEIQRGMMEELAALSNPQFFELLEWVGELMHEQEFDRNGNEKPDKVNELYRYIISLAGRIKMAKELAAGHGVYIPMQRKMFGLDAEKKSTGAFEEMLKRVIEEG